MKPPKVLRSISLKFLGILIPTLALLAVLALAIYSAIVVKHYERNLDEKLGTISQVHIGAVAYPLWTLDFAALERSLKTLALHPEVTCVEVFDAEESAKYHWPENCADAKSGEKQISNALIFENQNLGELNLTYTTEPMLRELKRELLVGALFFILMAVGASIVAFIALQLIVGRPIHKLIESIQKAETTQERESVDWSSEDELGKVILAYNRMIQQVDENTTELIDAREQAESAALTKSRFLANMSHELRTPLNAVIGISEMLREEAEDEDKDTEPHDRVAASGRHLLHLIDDILDFSKIEAGKINLVVEQIELPVLLDEIIATIKPMAMSRGNTLTLVYLDKPSSIKTDPFRLKQIILNLLSNACKFTENGQIQLEVQEQASGSYPSVRFSVSDSGIGISEKQSKQLFEDFSQADTSTTRQYGGTGLGLAISQRLCKLLGGEISLRSELGHGSEFHFALPLIYQKNE